MAPKQTIPYKRLAPQDLYHMIDWVREPWEDEERDWVRRFERLRWHFEELPKPYKTQARPHLDVVWRARLVNGQPWQAALVQLGAIANAWGKSLDQPAQRPGVAA